MAKAKKEYKYECVVEYSDGKVAKLDELPECERKRLAEYWGKRMADTFSEYYATYPEAYIG